MADKLPPITAVLDADISSFSKNLDKADKQMGQTEEKGKGHFSALGAAAVGGLAVAGGAAIAFGASSIGAFERVATETQSMQRITGESAETMSRLRFAGEETGVSADVLAKNFVRLSKDVGTGNKALAANGIAVKDAQGNALSMTDVLGNTAQAFATMPDGIAKTTLATQLFGKAGVAMIPLLDKGKAGLAELGKESDKFGLTIGQDGVNAMQKNVMAHRELHAAWQGLQVQLGAKLMPIVATITSWFASKLPGAMDWVKKAITAATPAFEAIGRGIQKVIAFVKQATDVFHKGGLAGVIAFVEQKWRENWPKIEAFLVQAGQKILTAVVYWFKHVEEPLLKELAHLAEQIGSWLWNTGLPILVKNLEAWGKALWAWVQPMISPALRELGKLLGQLGEWILHVALPAIGNQLAEWGKALWAWIQPMIVPMLGELVKLLAQLGNWLLDTALPAILNQLGEWALAFVEWVGPQIPPLLAELGILLLKLGDWLLTTALPAILEKLGEWALAFIEWVGPQIPPLLLELGKLYLKLLDWIYTTALPGILEKLGEWAAAFIGWVAGAAAKLPGKLADIGSAMLSWIGDRVVDIAVQASKWGDSLFDWVAGVVADIPGELGDIITGFLSWAGDLGSKLGHALGDIPGDIWTAFKNAWNALGNLATITLPKIHIPIPFTDGFDIGGETIRFLPSLYTGGDIASAGIARVGEFGAEDVLLPTGAKVLPHGQSAAAPSGDTHFHLAVNMPPGANGDDVVRVLSKWVRRNGQLPANFFAAA